LPGDTWDGLTIWAIRCSCGLLRGCRIRKRGVSGIGRRINTLLLFFKPLRSKLVLQILDVIVRIVLVVLKTAARITRSAAPR
jgi:hypothetical protein